MNNGVRERCANGCANGLAGLSMVNASDAVFQSSFRKKRDKIDIGNLWGCSSRYREDIHPRMSRVFNINRAFQGKSWLKLSSSSEAREPPSRAYLVSRSFPRCNGIIQSSANVYNDVPRQRGCNVASLCRYRLLSTPEVLYKRHGSSAILEDSERGISEGLRGRKKKCENRSRIQIKFSLLLSFSTEGTRERKIRVRNY